MALYELDVVPWVRNGICTDLVDSDVYADGIDDVAGRCVAGHGNQLYG